MVDHSSPRWRRLLPWAISAATLAYVFGFATNWTALVEATRGANLPVFVLLVTLDKLIFFLWWGILQAVAVRRFVTPVSTREVVSVRGGAELLRSVNNPLSDAAFLYGMAELTGGRVSAVVAAVAVPFVCHFTILMLQATLALAFVGGGVAGNPDIAAIAAVGWAVFGSVALATRTGMWSRTVLASRYGAWLHNVSFQALTPLFGWFVLLAAFDVLIQGLASQAFGIPLPWWELAGRIPILYLVLVLPSFGNFGTREIAWAALFADDAPREALIAYALATNTLFLLLHVVIGALFLPRALTLIGEIRRRRREGASLAAPLPRDASDP